MFARPAEMEPGMWFRARSGDPPLLWGGVERVVSRFPDRRRVRVVVLQGGRSFVCDPDVRFQIIEFDGGR